jgi:hypothetical protein
LHLKDIGYLFHGNLPGQNTHHSNPSWCRSLNIIPLYLHSDICLHGAVLHFTKQPKILLITFNAVY